VARIEVIEEESAAADEVKRKEKERYWALYGKGKLAQFVWKEMPIAFDIFH
jgi:hypothetical protein